MAKWRSHPVYVLATVAGDRLKLFVSVLLILSSMPHCFFYRGCLIDHSSLISRPVSRSKVMWK